MKRVLFSFLLKRNSHHPYTFTAPLQQTLKQNHRASHNCYSVGSMLKLLAFKWLLNELLLEKKMIRGHANLVISLIGTFFKILFFTISTGTIYLVISASLEKLSLFHLQISLWQHCFVYLLFFFLRKVSSSSFFCPVF